MSQSKNITKFTSRLKSLQSHFDYIKSALSAKVDSFPQNDEITMLGDSCFTMSSSNLSNNCWSPEYYNFKNQYKKIIEIISDGELTTLIPKLQKILKDKKLRIDNNYYYHFHPVVLKHLRSLL